jgi:hypothetical protein
MRFDISAAVLLRIQVFWDVAGFVFTHILKEQSAFLCKSL